jgi:Trk K+ transport system NAD-binding subunit
MRTFLALFRFLPGPQGRRNLQVLARLLAVFVVLVIIFSVAFHYLMELEGRRYSWTTGVYWTMVVMSSLGFGDITFESDIGRAFSVLVLVSGSIFMLVLLPFMLIHFFYVPWMESQSAARAPREIPATTRDHVVLTGLGPIESVLIKMMQRYQRGYVLIVPDLNEALQLFDRGYRVMLGDLDDPETYRRARVDQAALVATTRSDTANTNVSFTVQEISETVPVVATVSSPAAVDILQLAGCDHVLQLGEMLGQALARRILGQDARCHVIGEFGDLLIAEAAPAGTPLVGLSLREARLRDRANINVVGVWQRGHFEIAGPETRIHATSTLVLAGSREQLDTYNAMFGMYRETVAPVIIVGGGRVGRAVGRALEAEGIACYIVERQPERIRDPERYIQGDAAELEVLNRAGIMEAGSVVITTHDDDINIFLTIYCRRLRPDAQILARATLERNVSTLHRAGADFVLSYATTGATIIFNLLRQTDILLLAEGLSAFRLPVPASMVGKSIAACSIRRDTGCNVIAVVRNGAFEVNPDPSVPLPRDAQLVIIGDVEAESRFVRRFTPE